MKIFELIDKGNDEEDEKILNRLFKPETSYFSIRDIGIFILDNELYIESNRWEKLLYDSNDINTLKKYFVYTSTNSISIKPELYSNYTDEKCFTAYSINELFFAIRIENITLDILNKEKMINFFIPIYEYLLNRIKFTRKYEIQFSEGFKNSEIYKSLNMEYTL